MSGGFGGGGTGKGASTRAALGVSINTKARPKVGELPGGPTNKGPGRVGGESRIAEASRVEQQPSTTPVSKGPSGIDTGGSGTDPASMLARASSSANRARRARMARGGGLSNVLAGGATLG